MRPPTGPSESNPRSTNQPPEDSTGLPLHAEATPPVGNSPAASPPSPSPGTPSAEAETVLHPGRPREVGRIGPYEVEAEIARGGMGVIYRARHVGVGRIVALKMIRAEALTDPDHAQRFEREVRAAVRLSHPNVVPVYDVGQHQGQQYYTMALLTGNLSGQRQRLAEDARAVVILMEKIARAVHYAHEQGVVHRDLKPSNILIDERGEPQVSDFGLAKLAEPDLELTRTGMVLGTPTYMAPEQAAGRVREVCPATDVWALGVMLFELLTGRKPFVGETAEEVKQRILYFQPPAPRTVCPRLAPALEAIILRCLEKKPRDRYPTAAALAEDLDRFLRGERVATPRRGWTRWLRNTFRKHPLQAATALCLTAVLAWATLALFSAGKPVPQPDALPALVLLGDGAPSGPLNWVLGDKDAVVESDRPFRVRAKGLAVLELQAHCRWDRFRLEAKVRHEDCLPNEDGEVGIFVAHQEYNAPQGQYHGMAKFGFADQGKGSYRGKTDFRIWHVSTLSPQMGAYSAVGVPHHFDLVQQMGAPSSWRKIALEVTPGAVQAFWEDQPVAEISLERMVNKETAVAHNLPFLHWQFNPAAGVGIYVDQGTASFQDVTVRPTQRR